MGWVYCRLLGWSLVSVGEFYRPGNGNNRSTVNNATFQTAGRGEMKNKTRRPGLLNAREIAATLGLSRRTIFYKAKRENWPKVILPTNGGLSNFFIIKKLPEEIRCKIFNTLPPIARPKSEKKIDKAIDQINRATDILVELKNEGYEKREINHILLLAKQSLRQPREGK